MINTYSKIKKRRLVNMEPYYNLFYGDIFRPIAEGMPQKISSKKAQKNFDTNKFLKNIRSIKKYKIKLKNKIIELNNIKKNNYNVLDHLLVKPSNNLTQPHVAEVSYILNFSFSKTNTTLHVMDCSGNIKFFYTAGELDFKGKQKTFQSDAILKKFYKILVFDLTFLKSSSLAIHFKNKNVSYKISWFLKKLREKFFISVVKFFSVHPYNGCRRKKQKRKKFKTAKKKIWLSGLKR